MAVIHLVAVLALCLFQIDGQPTAKPKSKTKTLSKFEQISVIANSFVNRGAGGAPHRQELQSTTKNLSLAGADAEKIQDRFWKNFDSEKSIWSVDTKDDTAVSPTWPEDADQSGPPGGAGTPQASGSTGTSFFPSFLQGPQQNGGIFQQRGLFG